MKTLEERRDDPRDLARAPPFVALGAGALRRRAGGGGRTAAAGPRSSSRPQHAALGVFAAGHRAASLLLIYAFLTFDFSVRYVAINTNLGTPFYYRITALWGALEGSIVLWAWMLSLYTLIVIACTAARAQPRALPVGAHRSCSRRSPRSSSW